MNFLWLAYRKYEYRYTIIRWTVYILIRTLVIFLINIPRNYNYDIFQDGYIIQILLLSLLVERFFLVLDLIQFVFYSRKFYLHLKSREKEIKLFYFDERAYLESKYLLIHFKIATILVGIALFFFTIGGFIITPLPDTLAIYLQVPFTNLGYIIFVIYYSLTDYLFHPSLILYKVVITCNYLYIFIAVVYMSYRDRKKLANINNYIKPIMKHYHESCYDRYYTNYA